MKGPSHTRSVERSDSLPCTLEYKAVDSRLGESESVQVEYVSSNKSLWNGGL